MGFLFSKPEPRITNHDRAVIDLKNQRDKLRQFSRQIEKKIEKDSETIKHLLKDGKRDKAMLALKRKKYQTEMLEKHRKLMDNVEEMINSIQFAQVEVKVFNSLKQGANSLKAIHKEINIGELEDIMADTEEGIQKQKVFIIKYFSKKLSTFYQFWNFIFIYNYIQNAKNI